jgi:hypothetical protein
MGYRFRKNKNIGKQAVKILNGQIDKARASLTVYAADPVASVHTARQCFKRARSLLQLLHDADPYLFSVENTFFKDMGRRLAGARDRDALQETFHRLEELQKGDYDNAIKLIRRWFDARESELTAIPADHQAAVNGVIQSLQAAQGRLHYAQFADLKHWQLLKRLDFTRRQFGRRYRKACLSESATAYHEWRKVTKRLNDQLRLCAALDEHATKRTRKQVSAIAATLGLHQDAAILRERFMASPYRMSSRDSSQVADLFEHWLKSYRSLARRQMIKLLESDAHFKV